MSRVYAIFLPGMFGFGRLAGYDYFCHLERALEVRFEEAGLELSTHVITLPPTASLRRRARRIVDVVARRVTSKDPVLLVGHSTGGLDARLLLSAHEGLGGRLDDWRSQVRAVAMINTPHHGTPLAAHFTTVSGTRLLYAMSLLTVTSLSLGHLPLTAFTNLVELVGRLGGRLGNMGLVEELGEQVLRVLGEEGRREVLTYLSGMSRDQGGIVQLMPEAMDLFNMTVPDRPGVRYGCVATSAPAPQPLRLAARVRSPVQALSAAVYAPMWAVAGRGHGAYPLPPPPAHLLASAEAAFGELRAAHNDGVVPTLSMMRGEPIWMGSGDHLDVVGHFHDDDLPAEHVDWLTSGARFGRREHGDMCDELARFLLDALD